MGKPNNTALYTACKISVIKSNPRHTLDRVYLTSISAIQYLQKRLHKDDDEVV